MPDGVNEERWKKIPTPSICYLISSFGTIKSEGRWVVNRNQVRRWWAERLLIPTKGGTGYWCIVLDGVNYWVHRLVAKAFLPNPDKKRCVNHKDTDKRNNHVDNLEWVTHQENMDHLMRQAGDGRRVAAMKLTQNDRKRIAEILLRNRDQGTLRHWMLSHKLARRYKVGPDVIWRIRRSLGIMLKSGPRGA